MSKSLLNKSTGLQPATLLKKEVPTEVFFCELCKLFQDIFLQNTTRRLFWLYLDSAAQKRVNRRIWSHLLKSFMKNHFLFSAGDECANPFCTNTSLHFNTFKYCAVNAAELK